MRRGHLRGAPFGRQAEDRGGGPSGEVLHRGDSGRGARPPSLKRVPRVWEPPVAYFAAVPFDRLLDLRPQLGIALHELRPQVAIYAEHVLDHEHLTVAIRSGADPD